TTDSAAVLRASEMGCDLLLKGTKVDGVYDQDPLKSSDARRYLNVDYASVLTEKLNVMDMASIALARDNHLPLVVFSIREENSFVNVMEGAGRYTLVSDHGKAQYA